MNESNNNNYDYNNDQDMNVTDTTYTEETIDNGKRPRWRKKKNGRHMGRIGKAVCTGLVIGGISGGMILGSFAAGINMFGTSDSGTTTTSAALSTVSDTSSSSSEKTYSVSDIAAKCTSSVVAITNKSVSETQNMFGQNSLSESESAGSGVIISKKNNKVYIITNYHVIEDADTLTVCFNDSKKQVYSADVLGTDEENDLAVISVSTKDMSDDALNNLTVATIGDSSEAEVGDQVVAIGNALGYGQSVTSGYISALNKEVTESDGTTAKLIQTDAAINPGNSGGALFNMQGELIGINSSKYSDTSVEGMGFAIPTSTVESILDDLMSGSTRTKRTSNYGYLGIYGQDVSSESSDSYNIPEGVYITQVIDGEAADDAGLKKGDVITKLAGKSVSGMSELQSYLQYYKAGKKVKITYARSTNGSYKTYTTTVTLGSSGSSSTENTESEYGSSNSGSSLYGSDNSTMTN